MSKEIQFMPSAATTDEQMVEAMIFASNGRVLTVDGKLPTAIRSEVDTDLRMVAVRASQYVGVNPSKMTALYGEHGGQKYRVFFLVQAVDSQSIPPTTVDGKKVSAVDLSDLVASHPDAYRGLFRSLVSYIFPATVSA